MTEEGRNAAEEEKSMLEKFKSRGLARFSSCAAVLYRLMGENGCRTERCFSDGGGCCGGFLFHSWQWCS